MEGEQYNRQRGHIGSTLYPLPYRGGYEEGSISNLLLTFNKIPLYPLFLHRHRASLVPSIQGGLGWVL